MQSTNARLFTTVARCLTGTITKSTTTHPLFGEITRTFMRSASASPFSVVASTTNLSSYSLTSSGTNTILNTGTTQYSQQQITNNNNNETDEQRRFRSNRSRRGLYDGKDIRTGNNLSFSMKHTKRTFKPNVFIKRVYSEILDEMVQFHLTTSTLRSIDKCGGLDNYLLTSRHITSGEGLKTKKRIVSTLKYRERKARPEQPTTMATEEA